MLRAEEEERDENQVGVSEDLSSKMADRCRSFEMTKIMELEV